MSLIRSRRLIELEDSNTVFGLFLLANKVGPLLCIDFLWILVWQNFDLRSTSVYISSRAFYDPGSFTSLQQQITRALPLPNFKSHDQHM